MTASHFIFIPIVLLIGMYIGWVLGSRAAKDAYMSEMKKWKDRQAREPRRNPDTPMGGGTR